MMLTYYHIHLVYQPDQQLMCKRQVMSRLTPHLLHQQDPQGRTTNGPQSMERRHEPDGTAGFPVRTVSTTTITGYACACPDTTAPTRPSVVLDPFAGTGTVPAVAHALGRHGIGIDLSADYLRLAEWRCNDPVLRAKVLRVERPKAVPDGQLDIFGGGAA